MNDSPKATISDLHTVKEDEYDDEDDEINPAAFVHNRKEYEDHIQQVIENDLVQKMIEEHINKIKIV